MIIDLKNYQIKQLKIFLILFPSIAIMSVISFVLVFMTLNDNLEQSETFIIAWAVSSLRDCDQDRMIFTMNGMDKKDVEDLYKFCTAEPIEILKGMGIDVPKSIDTSEVIKI